MRFAFSFFNLMMELCLYDAAGDEFLTSLRIIAHGVVL